MRIRTAHAQSLCAAAALVTLGVLTAQAGTGAGCGPNDPGLTDLVILDPHMDPNGLPAVHINNNRQVEIPPAVHVHRYYYSGDKEYQAPIITGGPTIVVARHPLTSDQLNIDVMLPAGAPLISYTAKSITYVYPHQRVVISFCRLLSCKVKVIYVKGHGLGRTVHEDVVSVSDHINDRLHSSSLASAVKQCWTSTHKTVVGAVGVAEGTAAFVIGKTGEAVQVLPGVQALQSLGDQSQECQAEEKVRQAGITAVENAQKTIATNR
jgi:hypothetical protein